MSTTIKTRRPTPRAGAIRAPQPDPPVRSYSFTDWQVNNPTAPPPGNQLDGNFDLTNNSITYLISWVATSLNTDGSLGTGTVGNAQLVPGLFDDLSDGIIADVQPLVNQATASATSALNSAVTAENSANIATQNAQISYAASQAAQTAYRGAMASESNALSYATTADNAAGSANTSSINAQGAEGTCFDYAVLTQAWAEHMPDTIPPNILAVMGITGDHWSARWWANHAAEVVGGPYLLLAGGQMQGDLQLYGPPVQDNSAATKLYVDEQIASVTGASGVYYTGTWQVASNMPNISGGGITSGDFMLAVTMDPLIPETAPAGIPGIGGMVIENNARILWDNTAQIWQMIPPGRDLQVTDQRYLQLTGGVLTGALTLAGDAVQNLQPVTLQQLTAAVASIPAASVQLPLMNGLAAIGVSLAYARADHVHPSDTSRVTQAQGDARWLQLTGGVLTGPLTLPAGSAAAPALTFTGSPGALFGTVGGLAVGVGGAPVALYSAPSINFYVPLSMQNQRVINAATPTAQSDLATKDYVDNNAGAVTVADTPPTGANIRNGSLWWDSLDGQLYIQYVDPTSSQWVIANSGGIADAPDDGVLYGRQSQLWHPVPAPPAASTTLPLMAGAGAVGVGTSFARNDHQHPTDTSRYAASNPSGFQTAAQVTATVNGAVAGYLPLTGGTVSGQITCQASVTSTLFQQPTGAAAILREANGGTMRVAYGVTPGGQPVFDYSANNGPFYGCVTTNNFQYPGFAAGGGPVSVVLNCYDNAANLYGIFADAACDARIKQNIEPTAVDALAVLVQVPVEQFDIDPAAAVWIRSTGQDPAARDAITLPSLHVPIGLVAQHVQPVVPEAVHVMENEYQRDDCPLPKDMHNIVLQQFVPYLIRAVQQLAAEIAALKAAHA